MTRCRTRPASRLQRIPTATSAAPRPVCGAVSVNVVVWGRLPERSARALHQEALDEHVDVAVEHAVDVADLLLRAVILHELVGVQHVAADLAAERDVLLRAADLLELLLILLDLQIV